MLTLTADRLAALEAQGFIVDEWERWQQAGCLEYAVALQRRHSHLRFGSFGRTDTSDPAYPSDDVQHHFAHDDTHAYDSAGTHLLPYLGIAGDADFCRLDEQASWYEMPHDPEVLAALDHINRHPILKAGTTMSLPDIQNWFTPEENDDQAPEWQVGTIYFDGQGYSPDEVDAFAVQLSKLAAMARARVTDGDEQLMDLLTSAAQLGFSSEVGTRDGLRREIEAAMSHRIKRFRS